MYIVYNLSRQHLLQLDQQQVMNADNIYIPPRRNIAFSILPHNNSNVLIIGNNCIGLIQDPPQAGSTIGEIDDVTAPTPIWWDITPTGGVSQRLVKNLSIPKRTEINILNDTLEFSDDSAVFNIGIEYSDGNTDIIERE